MDYRKTLEQVMELLNNAEELNMNNYNEEQVRLLNDTFIEAYLFIERALAEPSDENAVLPIHSVVGQSEQLNFLINEAVEKEKNNIRQFLLDEGYELLSEKI